MLWETPSFPLKRKKNTTFLRMMRFDKAMTMKSSKFIDRKHVSKITCNKQSNHIESILLYHNVHHKTFRLQSLKWFKVQKWFCHCNKVHISKSNWSVHIVQRHIWNWNRISGMCRWSSNEFVSVSLFPLVSELLWIVLTILVINHMK